ncbi:hypothetical protein H2248_012293 [Termitomyces sp. 'cryptogamus']|nr:hypothetical protein H2248_012293 [Termitomyces sp. 'cryptogamus']
MSLKIVLDIPLLPYARFDLQSEIRALPLWLTIPTPATLQLCSLTLQVGTLSGTLVLPIAFHVPHTRSCRSQTAPSIDVLMWNAETTPRFLMCLPSMYVFTFPNHFLSFLFSGCHQGLTATRNVEVCLYHMKTSTHAQPILLLWLSRTPSSSYFQC